MCLPFRPLPYLPWPITCDNNTGLIDLTFPPPFCPFRSRAQQTIIVSHTMFHEFGMMLNKGNTTKHRQASRETPDVTTTQQTALNDRKRSSMTEVTQCPLINFGGSPKICVRVFGSPPFSFLRFSYLRFSYNLTVYGCSKGCDARSVPRRLWVSFAYTKSALEDFVLSDPTLERYWKILAHPSKYLSNIFVWATQPLAKVL